MPVVGHALLGWATAAVLPARLARVGHWEPRAAQWWLPFLIGLAYLPDLALQALRLGGANLGRGETHSWRFALGATVVAGLLALAARGRRDAVVVVALTAFSVWLHDAADVLQGSRATRWWPLPFIGQRLRFVVPDTLPAELAVFGTVLAGALLARLLTEAARGQVRTAIADVLPANAVTWVLSVSLAIGAVVTYQARTQRLREIRRAAQLIEERQYADALVLVDRAERWPNPARPGRLDYLRAEAFAGLGDRDAAERHYKISLAEEPDYFCAVADLAVLYASGNDTPERRRAAAEPLTLTLRREFPGHPDLERVLRRIERRIAGL